MENWHALQVSFYSQFAGMAHGSPASWGAGAGQPVVCLQGLRPMQRMATCSWACQTIQS